jgi:hypothetical protein
MSAEVHLDRLLGRQVLAGNNRPIGRLEEFHASIENGRCEIREFAIGVAGLSERLGVGVKLLFGRSGGGYIARWDQLDLSDPQRPRLTCPVEELQKLA